MQSTRKISGGIFNIASNSNEILEERRLRRTGRMMYVLIVVRGEEEGKKEQEEPRRIHVSDDIYVCPHGRTAVEQRVLQRGRRRRIRPVSSDSGLLRLLAYTQVDG